MSITELVPSAKFRICDPTGPIIEGKSLRERTYQMRAEVGGLAVDEIMRARGVDDVEAFLSSSLRSMPDPSVMEDMDIASARLADAIERKESILVFGDYDVDGACSSAIMNRFLRMVGHDCDVYIPDRTEDGYGPSEAAFKKCLPENYDLVVFVDCGTASGSLLDKLSCDVVVVDHHKQQGDLPMVHAVVNPHREDDRSGLDMVCAAGLAFMLCAATRRTLRARGFFENGQPDLKHLLDLAALATVSDVVPLIGLSRILVAGGLEMMRRSPSIGVGALMAAAGVEEPSAGRIGFGLGPRINAAGRVGGGTSSKEGALGFELLVCENEARAGELAARLNSLNSERQAVEKSVLEESMEMAEEQASRGVRIVCVASENWHPGVIGIVAGRLRERFGVPAIVGSIIDEVVKGSGRSVPGFDLGSVIIEARSRGILAGGGGHAMACGLSAEMSSWEEFKAFAAERAEWAEQPIAVDCRERADGVMLEQILDLDIMEPVGQGNPSPVVMFEAFEVRTVKRFGKGHVRLLSDRRDMEALFWRAEDDGLAENLDDLVGKTVSVIGVPRVDEWNGRRKVSINASDIVF